MFNNNTYLCSTPSDLHLNGADEILLHHHDLFSADYFPPNDQPLFEPPTMYNNHDFSWLNEDLSAIVNTFPRKSSDKAKKDRHSKIFTSQGPRDRRVRLSIGIARKFFDLQEMLGYDKPSKTLDWLLNKSKAAIKELAEIRVRPNAVSSAKSNYSSYQPRKKVLIAKESRAKARARARERTREKMCHKQKILMNESARNYSRGCDLYPSIPVHQYMNNYQLGPSGFDAQNQESTISYPFSNYAAANHDLIQKSIVINSKLKHPPASFGFEQNVIGQLSEVLAILDQQ